MCPAPAPVPNLQPDAADEHGSPEQLAALQKLAALRLRSNKDALPCRVADGLFIGAAGAARNLKALRKRGITHVVNASPSVPCYFKDNPEGCFRYLALQLFDDADAGELRPAGAADMPARRACLCAAGWPPPSEGVSLSWDATLHECILA